MNSEKMKRQVLSVVLNAVLLLLCMPLKAQPTTVLGGNQAKGMDMNLYPYGTIAQFGLPEKTTSGSVYLYDDWRLGTAITNKGTVIKNYPFKIDLVNQAIEINTSQGVRALEIKQIDTIRITSAISSQIFINARKYNGHRAQVTGLAEVVHGGDLSLLKYNYIYTKEGAYNATLDMGNNELSYSYAVNITFLEMA